MATAAASVAAQAAAAFPHARVVLTAARTAGPQRVRARSVARPHARPAHDAERWRAFNASVSSSSASTAAVAAAQASNADSSAAAATASPEGIAAAAASAARSDITRARSDCVCTRATALIRCRLAGPITDHVHGTRH